MESGWLRERICMMFKLYFYNIVSDPRTQTNQNGQYTGAKSFRWKYGQFRYLCQSNAMTQVTFLGYLA